MEQIITQPLIDLETPIITEDFKKFLRQNKLTIEKYFVNKLNKRDLLTGEIIPFKDIQQYITTDFTNKKHLPKWLSEQTKEVAQEYIKKKIRQRIAFKSPQFQFSQIELRSIKYLPSLDIILRYFDNYEEAYNTNSKYIPKPLFDYTVNIDNSKKEPTVILVDTREQKPLSFGCATITQKLDFGDYTYSAQHYNGVHFERKSIQDLFGTMSKLKYEASNYSRFNLEVERAKRQGCYLIVLVEYPYYKAQSYNHNKRFSQMAAENVFHNIRELIQKHDNLQFVFTGSRERSAKFIEKAVNFRDELKKIDIQYYLDSDKIILEHEDIL